MSISGGIPRAISRGEEIGCKVLQIFVKNNNRWIGKALSSQEEEEFRSAWARSKVSWIVAHDCYLINLASPDRALWRRSMTALLDELERCEVLGLSHLVTHPGSHVGGGEVKGIQRIAQALDEIHEKTDDYQVRIALETTAGQGTSIGYRFEQLRDVLASCRNSHRIDVCLDTCHVFAAGYDIREKGQYLEVIEEFDKIVGLDRLRIFHFNDSKRGLGSRVDRHEHIGKGKIGTEAFAHILSDHRFRDVPKILETPKGKTSKEDRRNLRVLRSLLVDECAI